MDRKHDKTKNGGEWSECYDAGGSPKDRVIAGISQINEEKCTVLFRLAL